MCIKVVLPCLCTSNLESTRPAFYLHNFFGLSTLQKISPRSRYAMYVCTYVRTMSCVNVGISYCYCWPHALIAYLPPLSFSPRYSTPPQAKEYFLACVIPPDDEDWSKDAFEYFSKQVIERTVQLNVEYKIPGQQQVCTYTCMFSPLPPAVYVRMYV